MEFTRSAIGRTAGLALTVIVAGLAGCTGRPAPVETSGWPTDNLETIAQSYHDCMRAEDLPVEIRQNSEGKDVVVQFVASGNLAYQSEQTGSGSWVLEEMTEEEQQLHDRFAQTPASEPLLIVDGVDHSETFARCLTDSGYDQRDTGMVAGQGLDQTQLQMQVDSNNQWAACARENGHAGIADSEMPTLAGGSEYPRIILPAALDEVQLRDLLGVCPNFDSARAQARDQWWADNPGTSHYPEILPEPIIIIEAPSGTEDQAALDAYYRKHEILYEAANAHYQSQVTTESHAPSEPSAT